MRHFNKGTDVWLFFFVRLGTIFSTVWPPYLCLLTGNRWEVTWYTSPSFHMWLELPCLCVSSEVCVSVLKHRIMFVHVVWAQMILCGCVAGWWLAHGCLNLAFLRVHLCNEWEFAFVQCLLTSTCVTFSGSPNTGPHRLGGCQAGLHQVTITPRLSRNGTAAAVSCRGSKDCTWHREPNLP